MSNQLSKLKCVKSKRLSKKQINKAFMNSSRQTSIDFNDRIIPNALIVDVKTSNIKIGNAAQKVKDIEVAFNAGSINDEDAKKLFGFLEQFDETTIHKVIMDNHENFKIMKLSAFVELIKKHIDKSENPKIDTDHALTYYQNDRIITKTEVDTLGNIFCVTCDPHYMDYHLLKITPEFEVTEVTTFTDEDIDRDVNTFALTTDNHLILICQDDDNTWLSEFDNNLIFVQQEYIDHVEEDRSRVILIHNDIIYVAGLSGTKTIIRSFDQSFKQLLYLPLETETEIPVVVKMVGVDDKIYIFGGICEDDQNGIKAIIVVIDIIAQTISPIKLFIFNEAKYSFINDAVYNDTTNNLICTVFYVETERGSNIAVLSVDLDLNAVSCKHFESDDIIFGNDSDYNDYDQSIIVGQDGDVIVSTAVKFTKDDLKVGATLITEYNSNLGLNDTKLLIGKSNKFIGGITWNPFSKSVVYTTILEEDSAIIEIPYQKLLYRFTPVLKGDILVDNEVLNDMQSVGALSFSITDVSVSH